MQSSPPNKPVLPEPAKFTISLYPDTADWRWSERSKKQWKEIDEDDEYVAFYKLWSDPTTRPKFRKEFPYPLSIGEGPTISPAGKPILITEAYDKMFRRLLGLREEDLKSKSVKGAVITGQPGIGVPLTRSPPHTTTYWRIYFPGKTVFQKFMLAQLISAREVVLLCDSDTILLFFRGRVYSRETTSGFNFLPTLPINVYYPIWALVDVRQLQEPPIAEKSNIWPVQTSPPHPARWKEWSKQNDAVLLGMPLWNMEELLEGYVVARSRF